MQDSGETVQETVVQEAVEAVEAVQEEPPVESTVESTVESPKARKKTVADKNSEAHPGGGLPAGVWAFIFECVQAMEESRRMPGGKTFKHGPHYYECSKNDTDNTVRVTVMPNYLETRSIPVGIQIALANSNRAKAHLAALKAVKTAVNMGTRRDDVHDLDEKIGIAEELVNETQNTLDRAQKRAKEIEGSHYDLLFKVSDWVGLIQCYKGGK